jgi:hypothetical protein
MHLLGVVLIRFDRVRAAIRPRAARDAEAQAQLDTLLFRYEQPQEELAWGVDDVRGFRLVADSVDGAARSEASWPGNVFVQPRGRSPVSLKCDLVGRPRPRPPHGVSFPVRAVDDLW